MAEQEAWEAMEGSPSFSGGCSGGAVTRGSGEPDVAGRGSGEPDGAGRGSGETVVASRGSGELDGTSRGSGELDGTSRGSGELDGTSRGSGELDGTSRGSGELDGTSRGTGRRWRGAGTGGRWLRAGSGGRWRGAGSGGVRSLGAGTGGRSLGAGTGTGTGSWRRSGSAGSRRRSGSAGSRRRSGTSRDEDELDGTSGDEDGGGHKAAGVTGSESSPVGEAELNWGMAGGTDCGAAATCDDCGPDSISPTIKFDPAIHSAKLMYFFNDQLGSALGMTRRISSTNPHQNPSIKVRSSHVVRWQWFTNSSTNSSRSRPSWKMKIVAPEWLFPPPFGATLIDASSSLIFCILVGQLFCHVPSGIRNEGDEDIL